MKNEDVARAQVAGEVDRMAGEPAPAAMGDPLRPDGGPPRGYEWFGGLTPGAAVSVEHRRLEPRRGESRGPAPERHGDAGVTHRVRVVVNEAHQRRPVASVGSVSHAS